MINAAVVQFIFHRNLLTESVKMLKLSLVTLNLIFESWFVWFFFPHNLHASCYFKVMSSGTQWVAVSKLSVAM